MHRDLLVNYEKVVKFLNFICGVKIKLWRKFSGICQVNPFKKGPKIQSFYSKPPFPLFPSHLNIKKPKPVKLFLLRLQSSERKTTIIKPNDPKSMMRHIQRNNSLLLHSQIPEFVPKLPASKSSFQPLWHSTRKRQ